MVKGARMKIEELFKIVRKADDRYTLAIHKDGVFIADNKFETQFEMTYDALEGIEWPELQSFLTAGRDVKHITRVTGYFAFVEGWNKGKIGELRDRYKSQIK